MRSESEAVSKLKRRKKRKREKVSKGQEGVAGNAAEAGGGADEEAVAAVDELAPFQVFSLLIFQLNMLQSLRFVVAAVDGICNSRATAVWSIFCTISLSLSWWEAVTVS